VLVPPISKTRDRSPDISFPIFGEVYAGMAQDSSD
jgi:hypothetical protein